MGVVHHRNYLNWFEVGRTEWLRLSDVSYREIEEEGVLMPVTEIRAKYHQSAKYEDLVSITVWIESYNKIRLIFGYEVKNAETGQLLCTGQTEHVFIDREGRIVRLKRTHPQLFDILTSKARNLE